MKASEMSVEQFRELPYRTWNEETECIALIIVPTGEEHSSGYGVMDYIACGDKDEVICKIGGHSDVLHIEGIGGPYARFYLGKTDDPSTLGTWSIDCLPSGLLRLSNSNGRIRIGLSLSSVEAISIPHPTSR